MNAFWMIALVVFVEAFLHYFPWRLVLGGRVLHPVAAYVLGVLGLMVPFTVWLAEHGHMDIAWMLWTVIVAGGAAVAICYGLDWLIHIVWSSREAHAREQAARAALEMAHVQE